MLDQTIIFIIKKNSLYVTKEIVSPQLPNHLTLFAVITHHRVREKRASNENIQLFLMVVVDTLHNWDASIKSNSLQITQEQTVNEL